MTAKMALLRSQPIQLRCRHTAAAPVPCVARHCLHIVHPLQTRISSASPRPQTAVHSTPTDLQDARVREPVAAPGAESSSTFSWTRCWHPVMPLDYLDPDKPTPIKVLSKALVLWRDGERQWRCFEDQCPHRLAPLSEGRLETNGDNVQLMCSYHGWQFNSSGRCTSIPQSEDPKAEANACASQRSCVKNYPTREAYGLLWVWPEAGPSAALEAAAASPVVTQRAHDHYASGKTMAWYMRELPYGYDVLCENLTDPQHLPFSHHKLSPNLTRDKAGAMPFKRVTIAPGPSTASNGAAVHSSNTATAAAVPGADGTEAMVQQLASDILPSAVPPGVEPGSSTVWSFPSSFSPIGAVTFNPPGSIAYTYDIGGQYRLHTELLAAPTEPGRCKVFNSGIPGAKVTAFDLVKALFKPSTFMKVLIRFMFASMPTWRLHLFSNKLFDQDGIFLAMQDAALSHKQEGWAKSYYMPTSADACVITARKWMDAVGDPFGEAGKVPRTLPSRREMMDRGAQHTQHCRKCQQAQQMLQRRLEGAKVVAALAFAALCGVLGAWGPQGIVAGGVARTAALATVAVLGVSGLVARNASELLPQFSYVPFHHHSNH